VDSDFQGPSPPRRSHKRKGKEMKGSQTIQESDDESGGDEESEQPEEEEVQQQPA
jgi:hypothetical protein